MKKVFVPGCFDLAYSGHIKFLQEATEYGELYVLIGSDKTIKVQKQGEPAYNENECKCILEVLRCIKKVFIGFEYIIMEKIPEKGLPVRSVPLYCANHWQRMLNV